MFLNNRNIKQKPKLLDGISGVVAAFSTRKLRSAYTGPCLRIRRSGDNAESDIGFSGERLDINSLLNFVGSGSGYVVTWYDQSENNNFASQSTSTKQPRIVSSGTLDTLNNRASLYSDGANTYMTLNSIISLPDRFSVFSAFKLLGFGENNLGRIFANDGQLVFGMRNTGGAYATETFCVYDKQANVYYAASSNSLAVNGSFIAGVTFDKNFASNQIKLYKNGVIIQNHTKTTSFEGTSTGSVLFNISTADRTFYGNVSEVIVFNSNKDASASLISNNMKAFYYI